MDPIRPSISEWLGDGLKTNNSRRDEVSIEQ